MIPDYYEKLDETVVPYLKQRVAQLKRRLEKLKCENTELKAYLRLYDQSDQLATEPELRKSLIETGKERDQLRLQVVSLREALEQWLHAERCYPKGTQGWLDGHNQLVKALFETPVQSAKEVLSPALELLKRLHDDYLEMPDILRLIEQEIQRLERLCK